MSTLEASWDMSNDLTALEIQGLRRWGMAYALSDRAEFRAFGVRGALRLQWLRWLVASGRLTGDSLPRSSRSSSSASS